MMRTSRQAAQQLVTDAELLRRSDPAAFAEFYRRHAREVFGFFWNRTACHETAADLTAETFAQAYLSRRRYRGDAPARAWLFGIARHELSHFVRAAKVASKARRRLGMSVESQTDDRLERAEELADLPALARALDAALGTLPQGISAAIRLRVLEELSYFEVARRLECTPAAARQRVARGLDQLATHLEAAQ
jgi:RNA polymerase sigma factor (sigma-70 family)